MDVIRFALLGLGTGAVIASVALGLVLTYRASGVVNFAQGAMASWAAYTYYSLTHIGTLPILPAPLLPDDVALGEEPWPPVPALIVSVVVAGIIGMVIYLVVFRPLRLAAPLARIAAAVGVMITLQAAIVIRFGSKPVSVESVVPDATVDVFGIDLGLDRYVLLGVVVLVTVALTLVFSRTRFGLSVSAAAENERAATLVGISAHRLALVTWTVASMLAALVGVMATAITGLTPTLLTLTIVPALAAALVAGFTSFAVAAAVGVGIGMAQSVLLLAEVRVDGWPTSLGTALPFLVIALVMLATGRGLPERGSGEVSALPPAYAPPINRPRLVAYSGFAVLVALLTVWAPFDYRAALNASMIGTLLALSLVVVTGLAGQISLAQVTLAGLSAFAVGTVGTELGFGLLVALPAAVVVAVGAGLLFGLPSLRTRGASLAILTLAAAVAVQQTVLTHDGWFGTATLASTPPPRVLGLDLGPDSSFPIGDGDIPSPAFGLLLFVITALAACFVMRLRRTPLGIQMLAVRSNERAAASAGVNVAVVKLTAFGIAAALAGLGGAMTAYSLGSFTARSFDVLASLVLLAIAYMGGISTVGGAVWAGTLATGGLFVALQDNFYEAGQYTGYIAGIGLLLTVVLYPQGIDGATRAWTSSIGTWIGRRARRPETVAKAEAS